MKLLIYQHIKRPEHYLCPFHNIQSQITVIKLVPEYFATACENTDPISHVMPSGDENNAHV